MLLTYSPNELASFERSGLRSIGFIIPRAAGRPSDMLAASLVGLFSIRRLPADWILEPNGALAWINLARALDPEAFEQAQISARDALAAPVDKRDGPERLVFQFPALPDRDLDESAVELALAQEIERADASIRNEAQRRFLVMSESQRLAWAAYADTSFRAERALMDSARRIIHALNQAAPFPACLPEPEDSPFGWVGALAAESALQALDLDQELTGPVGQASPRTL